MYCVSLTNYKRFRTDEIEIGNIPIGGNNPMRIQTMTNTLTRDIEKTTLQVLECLKAGSEYVRITTPTLADVEALKEIKKKVLQIYPDAVIVADIHFSPKVALAAAQVAHKIRINPGNYVDKNTSNHSATNELLDIEKNLIPLLDVCKKNNTAIRIGTNHGSLSNRITQKYGNTPLGLVEATYEYIEIFSKLDFSNIVLSVKSSNPTVMVQANRMLVERLKKENIHLPLHLGVTEAGSKKEGRVKSALGIGALMIDGIGDTIRVSLTESPKHELPVCKKIIDYIEKRKLHTKLAEIDELFFDPFSFSRRETYGLMNIGGTKQLAIIADATSQPFAVKNFNPDFVIANNDEQISVSNNQIQKIQRNIKQGAAKNIIPLVTVEEYLNNDFEKCFVETDYENITEKLTEKLNKLKNAILIAKNKTDNIVGELRLFFYKLYKTKCLAPVIISLEYSEENDENFEIYSAIDSSVFLIDGMADGLMLKNNKNNDTSTAIDTSIEILQASHRRISKTEYISCPSCGRTLFDIEKVTEEIQNATKHLKGIKIAVMGCIVNGPGEIADADFGYIGAGRDLVNLYKGKKPVKINVPAKNAVNELLNLINDTLNNTIK